MSFSPAGQAAATRTDLPQYGHPPLVEVSLSIEWRPELRLDNRAQQIFLEQLGPTWQRLATPAHSDLLSFQSVLGEQRLELNGNTLKYVWDGREGEIYPRYEAVRDGFVAALDAWNSFVKAAGLSPTSLTNWTVSYLNRMPQGTVWTSLADCGFFRLMSPLPPSLPQLKHCEGRWEFALDQEGTVLECELMTTPGTESDPRPVLWLRLTCSGDVNENDGSVLEGLDYGRQAIVTTFRQLMSPAANAYWELQRER